MRSLKIRHNSVLGYFVEATAQNGEKFLRPPLNAIFIHRQTLAGQVRFTTTELGELEVKIASAAERALAIELKSFERLTALVTGAQTAITAAAAALASLDVAAALAELAAERGYVRPETDGSLDFIVEGGRHPVVERRSSPTAARSWPMIAISPRRRAPPPGASGSSPDPIWAASRPSCARTP